MKRVTLILTICIMLVMLVGCDTSDVKDHAADIAQSDNEYIKIVKNGVNDNYPDITYGEAFDDFFSSPTWKYFKGSKKKSDDEEDKSEDGEKEYDVVEFTGYCTYDDEDVKALIQFDVDKKNKSFEPSYLSLNKVSQSPLVMASLLEKVLSDGKDDTSEEDTSEDKTDDSENETKKGDDKVYSVGDTVKIKWIGTWLKYTITDFGSATADDGTPAIYFKYFIENMGKKEWYVSSDDFTIYADDYGVDTNNWLEGLKNTHGIHLASGKKTEGIFYVKKDLNTISKLEVSVEDQATYLLKDDSMKDGSGTNNDENDSDKSSSTDTKTNDTPDLSAELEYDEHDDYILDSSDSRYVKKSEVSKMSKKKLRLARNEIFARHGYIFDSADLKKYFNDKSWYIPSIKPSKWSDSLLNKYEKKNIALIKKYE